MKRSLLDYKKFPSNLPMQTFKNALCGQRNQGKNAMNGRKHALMRDFNNGN
jgi:hypothetical protein